MLRNRHNLVLVLGCRDDPRQLDKQQRDVFQQVFDLVDRHNLYGSVAYPKQHRRSQVPSFYRWAAKREGLFVNPALTEPFGLPAGGRSLWLPMVSTDDGGPRDIQARCDNGLLVDVTDSGALQEALERAGKDSRRWRCWSENGVEAVSRHFSWDAHVCRYLALMQPLWRPRGQAAPTSVTRPQRLLLLDLDSNLELPNNADLGELRDQLRRAGDRYALGLVTGRSLAAARQRYAELHLPLPQVWISRAGSEIHHGDQQHADLDWQRRIDADWDRDGVLAALADLQDQLVLQEAQQQGPWKVSYLLRQPDASLLSLVRQRLRRAGCRPSPCCVAIGISMSCRGWHHAVKRFGISPCIGSSLERVLLVASQQGDAELLRGMPAAVVPADHDPCLQRQPQQQRVFFQRAPAWGCTGWTQPFPLPHQPLIWASSSG